MAIPDVTREQLITAMELFDQELRQTSDWIGWEQKENHKYAIEYQGRRYPVKKIVSLATKAAVHTFISTEARRLLERMGFEVVIIAGPGAYIFQSNPKLFDLPGALSELTELTWVVRQSLGNIRRGDTVYLWEANPDAGILAVARVLTDPAVIPNQNASDKFDRNPESFAGNERRVRLKIERVLPERIRRTELLDHPILKNMTIIRRPAGTNFKLTDEEAEALADCVDEMTGSHSTIEQWLDSVPYKHDLARAIGQTYPAWLREQFGDQIHLRQHEDRSEHGISVFYRGNLLQYLRFHKPNGLHVLAPNPATAELALLQHQLSDASSLERDDLRSQTWAYQEGYRFVVKTEADYEVLKRATRLAVQRLTGRSGRTSMAHIAGPHAARIYDAAQQFINAALRNDDSLFTPGRTIWTAANLQDLYERFVLQPDNSKSDFWTKLKRQLEGAPAATYQLTAELLYIHYLPASRSTVSGYNKRRAINGVLSWSPEPSEIPADLAAVLDEGIASMGIAFGNFKPALLRFLVLFFQAWKQLPQAEQERFLSDPWAFKDMLFKIPMQAAYSQREIFLHLVHPEAFEAIASRDHKQKINQAFARYVTQPTDDIDRRIAQIRQRLAREYGSDFNFYWEDIYNIWINREPPLVDPSPPPPPFDALGPELRSYIRLAISLGNASYTPEEMIDLAGRISPPIAKLSSAPDPDKLVADLMLLRLLEPLDDGRYRRWPHLADATEAHMLRYAALTLVFPVEGQDAGYMLPIEQVPQDSGAYPAAEWPGGEPLLAWYEQAGLVQRAGDGWQLRPDALEPLDAPTPTAQAINTFLGNLRRVRHSKAAVPSLESNRLPVLDPATLDARIAEIQRDLLIDRPTILRIYRSLIAGRHVILSGPPGTGKTHLARILPRILWRDESTVWLFLPARPDQSPTEEPQPIPIVQQGYAVDVVTATEDWGTRHVIGGIVPQLEQNGNGRSLVYGVRHGVLTRTVLQNYGGDGETIPDTLIPSRQPITIGTEQYRGRWLVIDEFTRAPIDAAFGSLLTTLGGQSNPKLAVPTDAGIDRDIPLPNDFRLIGTLNSFDRHFLNQISEAMKRRFTFIDVLPPSRKLAGTEQAIAIYRALLSLQANHLGNITADETAGRASWTGVLNVRREDTPDDRLTRVRYDIEVAEPEASAAVDGFWRLFEAIRVYRQLGTAQAESVYSTVFAGRSIGMTWQEALDSALADVLADQLQVLARDEQRVLVALIEHHDNVVAFTDAVKKILKFMPGPRQMSHLAQLRSVDLATVRSIDEADPGKLQPEHLSDLFRFDLPLNLSMDGLFVRRMSAFINEKGL